MIEQLEAWDKSLFRFLNGQHNEFLDFLMPWISDKYIWIPLYAVILYGLIKHSGYKYYWILLGIVLLIFLSDQAASGILKPWVQRFRPCYDPEIKDTVHLLKGCGGRFGFASSHASNSFAIAFLTWFLLKDKFKWTWVLIIWAAVVAYSRVYLGVHFPGDIIVGAILGYLAALIINFGLKQTLNIKKA
ncbi:phosphatase PAP2 family protein [Roseivirga pacifica]